jgi:hypothetical protein
MWKNLKKNEEIQKTSHKQVFLLRKSNTMISSGWTNVLLDPEHFNDVSHWIVILIGFPCQLTLEIALEPANSFVTDCDYVENVTGIGSPSPFSPEYR